MSLTDRRAAIGAVNRANDRLRQAIMQANEENLESLSEVWQGKAFTLIEDFALDMNQRYAQPLQVSYRYINPPAIDETSVPGQIVVTTTEEWTYGGSSNGVRETLEFIYTVTPIEGEWAIARYSYRNLPRPRTPAPAATITPTPVSTLEY
ncbi:MAG: hypothetical protein Kow0031_23980 [Anaerolineae bacterium]